MDNEKRRARALDGALHTGAADDDTRPLVETATHVRKSVAVDVPPADRQRALFLSGVAARERRLFSPARVLVPVLALAVILFAGFAGRSAVPGQRLYPVREALNSVGIGESPLEEIEDQLWKATGLVKEAEASVERNPGKALRLAVEALETLGPARALLPDLDGQRAAKLHQIESIEDRAVNVIVDASAPSDDDSGSGSDDSREGEDGNSGPGSDDSGDESSGPASDDSGSDDSGSDDSSGTGSGSDDSDPDDSSGSGSGGDSDRDDSRSGDPSGSGSGGEDSEVDDSSGSGSDDSSESDLDDD